MLLPPDLLLCQICFKYTPLFTQITSLHTRLSNGEMAKDDKARGMVWSDTENYKSMPLCRSIIMVLDRTSEGDFVNIKDEIHQQTLIIMILTGDSSRLNAPMGFESIESECLPLESLELQVDDSNIIMVRVKVGTAVKFITDFEKREQAAYPETRNRS